MTPDLQADLNTATKTATTGPSSSTTTTDTASRPATSVTPGKNASGRPVARGSWLGWTDVAFALFMYYFTLLGVTVGRHRLFTHIRSSPTRR